MIDKYYIIDCFLKNTPVQLGVIDADFSKDEFIKEFKKKYKTTPKGISVKEYKDKESYNKEKYS